MLKLFKKKWKQIFKSKKKPQKKLRNHYIILTKEGSASQHTIGWRRKRRNKAVKIDPGEKERAPHSTKHLPGHWPSVLD
jgi:hypothetical protein